jgi:arylsulfatase A-like enzyme
MPAGKQTPYETDIHVPLMVRGPGVRSDAHVARLAGNTDLAPTFEAMAGVGAPSYTDGRSLLPLLHGDQPAHWRDAFLLEHRGETGVTQPPRTMTPKGSTLEPPDPDQAGRDGRPRHREIRDAMLLNRGAEIPNYDGVRTSRYVYVQYTNGERELYDLRSDPDEIHNRAGTEPALEHRLADRIARLRHCAGAECRRVEDRPLRPAGAARRAATMRPLR